MTGDERDEGLHQAFQELRDDDRRAIPPFDRGRAHPPVGTRLRSAGHPWVWLAATILLVAGGVGLIALREANRGLPGPIAAASPMIGSWESPTGRLLLTAARDLTGELPRVGGFPFKSLDSNLDGTKDAGAAPLMR